MRKARQMISVALLLVSLVLLSAEMALSQTTKPKKAVAPATAQKQDVTVRLTSNYCDTALPYSFTDGPNGPVLTVNKNGLSGKMINAITTLDPSGNTFNESAMAPDVRVDSAPASLAPLALIDPGTAILGDPERELSPDGNDAMRLLVRTLYPSVIANACNPEVDARDANSGEGLVNANVDKTSKPFSFKNAKYYLIDIVRWETVSNGGQTMSQIAADHWYLFNYSDAKAADRKFPFTFHPIVTNQLRIYGESDVVFLAIHLAPNGDQPSGSATDSSTSSQYQPSWFDTVDVSYKLEATKVEPLNWQDLSQLINLVTGLTIPAPAPGAGKEEVTKQKLLTFQGRYGAALLSNLRKLPADLTSTMTVKFNSALPNKLPVGPYCVAVQKSLTRSDGSNGKDDCKDAKASDGPVTAPAARNDAQSENFDSVFGPRSLAQFRPVAWRQTQDSQAGGKTGGVSKSPTPGNQNVSGSNPNGKGSTDQGTATTKKAAQVSSCDMTTTAKDKTQSPCSTTQTIQDEGLYRWDISVAVPTPGYKDVSFSSSGSGNTLTAKSITRTDAYAMLDIAPWGEDFRNPPILGIPHFMTGLPLSGKTFNKPFIGGLGENFGLSKILPISMRVFGGVVYDKEQVPQTAGSTVLQSHRVWKAEYGVEFSLSSVISKLKSSGSGTKKPSNTTGSTGTATDDSAN